MKYLIADELNYYTVVNSVLQSVPVTEPLTAQQMQQYGCDTIPSGNLLVPLYSARVYAWSGDGEAVNITATATAIVGQQTIITDNADMSDISINGIRNVACDVSGTSLIAISWDNGVTWEWFDGSVWQTGDGGMSTTVLSAISTAQWQSYLAGKTSKQYKFKIILSQSDRIKAIKVNYTNVEEV